MGNPITKLESQNVGYDIGATFDNVFLGEDDNFSLKDLYDYMNDYFTNGQYIRYSVEAPVSTNVKIWYQIEEQEDTSNTQEEPMFQGILLADTQVNDVVGNRWQMISDTSIPLDVELAYPANKIREITGTPYIPPGSIGAQVIDTLDYTIIDDTHITIYYAANPDTWSGLTVTIYYND